MPYPFRRIRIAWLALCLLTMATPSLADSSLRVIVDVKPIHSVVAGLMAGVGEPELLVDSGLPWEWRATDSDAAALDRADLVIWLGSEITPGLATAIDGLTGKVHVLELLATPEIKVLPARHGQGRDPFVWLDTRNMLILVDLLTTELARIDPQRTHRYQSNRLEVLRQLSQVDRELEYGYKHVSAAPVFLYHDTQQYFEQAYAMKVAGIAAAADGESDTTELLALRNLLSGNGEACLFVEAGLSAPHLDLLRSAPSLRVVELDSLGSGLAAGPSLYEQLMRSHFDRIRACVASEGSPAPAASDDSLELYSHRIQAKYLLMDHFGETVSNLDFSGRYQLVYFGYTFCPDICPTSLAAMAQAMKILGPKADLIQPLFITIDPARDTLEVLRRYTAYFHPRLIGLTGPDAMIARTAELFRVRYEKVEDPDRAPDKYAMDHTASLFLLGPNSEFIAKFAHGMPPGELAARLDELVR